jgi:hypothetical protein
VGSKVPKGNGLHEDTWDQTAAWEFARLCSNRFANYGSFHEAIGGDLEASESCGALIEDLNRRDSNSFSGTDARPEPLYKV